MKLTTSAFTAAAVAGTAVSGECHRDSRCALFTFEVFAEREDAEGGDGGGWIGAVSTSMQLPTTRTRTRSRPRR